MLVFIEMEITLGLLVLLAKHAVGRGELSHDEPAAAEVADEAAEDCVSNAGSRKLAAVALPGGPDGSPHTSLPRPCRSNCPRTSSQVYSTWPSKRKPPPRSEGLIPRTSVLIRVNPWQRSQFFAVSTGLAGAGAFFAYLRRKRSTRPAVSMSFCFPVKKGWQAEQISTLMSPLWVDRVTNALPHAQCTRTSLDSTGMPQDSAIPEQASAALKSGTGTTLSQRIAGCR